MRETRHTLYTLAILLAAAGCKEPAVQVQENRYPAMKIEMQEKTIQNEYSAQISGRQDIAIYPQVSGFITDVCVNEGERVKKGQTLFIIDQVTYKAAVNTAKANVAVAEASLATAQLTYDSKVKLFEQNVISQFDLSTAENAMLSAKAQLAQMQAQLVNAENNLSYTVVKSPSDGVVGTIPYRTGALVGPTTPQPLTTVSDNSTMYVYFSLNENTLLELMRKFGSKEKAIQNMPPVKLRLNDRSIYGQEGRIESISGVIDRNTGSVSVRAAFPNSDGLLHSGSSGNVIMPETFSSCIVIPKVATYEIQDNIYVFRINDGTAKSTIIEAKSVKGESQYIVTSGLETGDIIIASGAGLVKEGTKVTPVFQEQEETETQNM